MAKHAARRTIAYVDGFNLYYGLRECNRKSLLWLNIQALAQSLIPDDTLIHTKYFTTRISGPASNDGSETATRLEAKRKRQSDFLDALATLQNFSTLEGKWVNKRTKCRQCDAVWKIPEEKMTDVRIATEMLVDAYQDNFDVALLISADSDLVPPVKAICSLFPAKRTIVAFPPNRSSTALVKAASEWRTIRLGVIENCQFPESLVGRGGYILKRPDKWSL